MPLPSLFHRHHCRMHILGIWISSFLPVVGCCSALVIEIANFDLCFYAEDYCDGVVTCLCSGIDTCRFPCDDAVLRLLILTYLLLTLVLAVLLYAYVLVGPLVLVVW
jgi:hypothetical protein